MKCIYSLLLAVMCVASIDQMIAMQSKDVKHNNLRRSFSDPVKPMTGILKESEHKFLDNHITWGVNNIRKVSSHKDFKTAQELSRMIRKNRQEVREEKKEKTTKNKRRDTIFEILNTKSEETSSSEDTSSDLEAITEITKNIENCSNKELAQKNQKSLNKYRLRVAKINTIQNSK